MRSRLQVHIDAPGGHLRVTDTVNGAECDGRTAGRTPMASSERLCAS